MEFLIPGLILVALMAYVSTRIKRASADAYAEENVQTEILSITKPNDFIIIELNDPCLVFAAYSKEFGTDNTDAVRQVSAELRVHRAKNLGQVREMIAQDNSQIADERHLAGHSLIIESKDVHDGISVEREYRLSEKGTDVFEFCVAALSETKDENQKAINTLLSSYELR